MSDLSASKNNDNGEQKIKLALDRELLKIWLSGAVVLIAGYILLIQYWEWKQASQWFFQSCLLWWLIFHLASRRVGLNRPEPKASLFTNLGWANRLTLLRGGLTAMTGGFIFLTIPPGLFAWIPGVLYTTAAITDRVDGYVARKARHQSLLGVELDMAFDALGLAVAPILAVWYGQIHWSYLMVSIAYYLFQWGINYRKQRGLPVYTLMPTHSRRAIAGYQMGFIAVVLWPLFQPPVTTIAGFAFMIPLLTGFFVDWLIVSGRIDPESSQIASLFKRVQFIRTSILLPILRILIALLMCITLVRSEYSLIPGRQSELLTTILIYSSILATILILLGILGRLSSLALILVLDWHYLMYPVGLPDITMLFCVVWVMSLGTGRYSLWQWDEKWVHRYDGA